MVLNCKRLLESFREPSHWASIDSGAGYNGTATVYLREAFQKKDLRPTDVDLGRLFTDCFGWQNFLECRARNITANEVMARSLLEAPGAVTTAAFTTITQQFVYNTIREAYELPELIFTKMIPSQPTTLRTERIPGISDLGDENKVVPEGEPYPLAGVSEVWQDTPVTQKRGVIVPLTKEAVFFDRTGILVDRCSKVGKWLAYNKELRAIDAVVDENGGAVEAPLGGHRFNYRGTSYASYGDSSAAHPWDNLQASNAFTDWTQVEKAELLFDAMTDPETGVTTGAFAAASNQIIVPTSLKHTARQTIRATQIRVHIGGYATSGNIQERVSDNTLEDYQIVTSPLLAYRMQTKTNWFVGNISKAIVYMENWPMQVKQAPSNSHDEFHRDIIQQYRADECGAYYVREPRFLVKNTA